jgi:hypothetical protein
MNIQVSYERPHTQWSVFNVFHLYYQHIVETNKDINFNYVNVYFIDKGESYDI